MRLRTAVMAAGLLALAQAAGAQEAEKGATLYGAQKCQMCHSIAGKGGKAGTLDGVAAKLSVADLKQWLVDPVAAAAKHKSTKKPAMPKTYAKLPAADIEALVAYLQTLK